MVLALCDRFHVLPSQVMGEDAAVLRLLKITALGTRGDGSGDG
jgi:hypothetical protein